MSNLQQASEEFVRNVLRDHFNQDTPDEEVRRAARQIAMGIERVQTRFMAMEDPDKELGVPGYVQALMMIREWFEEYYPGEQSEGIRESLTEVATLLTAQDDELKGRRS